ncbi:hypothetical protein LTR53_014793 [Teratosphaeriaceae sp. CCFEE 6253]|nr:hypothetical protein LTR53_014793 [Teratosphaeriaceae sp. CCFEE 6253]
MVATRNHPKDFPAPATEGPPKASPTKRPARASASQASNGSAARLTSPGSKPPPSPTPSSVISPAPPRPRTATTSTTPSRLPPAWSHTPTPATLLWLAVSLPLVIWDTAYVLLRPHSMPGGALHRPLWSPYELYGTVDYVYGLRAYEARNGWTAAQATLNAGETAAYLVYLYWVFAFGEREGAGVKGRAGAGKGLWGGGRTVRGRWAARAVVLAFATASLTFFKTVLYWLLEAFSGFDNIGHNDTMRLVFLWIIPNGAWLVLPLYMMFVFGREILQGLEAAAGGGKKTR